LIAGRHHPHSPRSGLTLVELVVVLMILVTLAGAAVVALEGLVEQSRYDSTQRTLQAFEHAVLGRDGLIDANKRPWIQGFVADMGRLPRAIDIDPSAEVENLQLQELWHLPTGAATKFGIQHPDGDPQVTLAVGWRGPYLNPPGWDFSTEGAQLLDGVGNPFVFKRADGADATLGDPIAQVISLGADGVLLPDGVGYDAFDIVVLESTVATEITPEIAARHLGDVPVRVSNLPAGSRVLLRVYGPRDGLAVTLDQEGPLAEAGGEVQWVFSNVPIGARVLRAYRLDSTEVPDEEAEVVSAFAHGPIVPITVLAGGIHEVVIEFPELSSQPPPDDEAP